MKRYEQLKANIEKISSEIGDTCLIAISKYHTCEDIFLAAKAGQRDFGESRVMDLKAKVQELLLLPQTAEDKEIVGELVWHFVGRLQTNKVKTLLKIPGLKYIHSVDSIRLLNMLFTNESLFEGDSLNFFLQVNVSGEQQKGGFLDYEEIRAAVDFVLQNKETKLKLLGLMTIGNIRTDNFNEDAIKCFQKVKSVKDQLTSDFPGLDDLKLSMGMSRDYLLAIEEGSSFIRVGNAIFDESF